MLALKRRCSIRAVSVFWIGNKIRRWVYFTELNHHSIYFGSSFAWNWKLLFFSIIHFSWYLRDHHYHHSFPLSFNRINDDSGENDVGMRKKRRQTYTWKHSDRKKALQTYNFNFVDSTSVSSFYYYYYYYFDDTAHFRTFCEM